MPSLRLDYESIPNLDDGYVIPASREYTSCSALQASSNLIKVILGAGMFYLPFACASMGWTAIALLILFGAITLYSMSLIAECVDIVLENKPSWTSVSFADLGQAAFGRTGRNLCSVSIVIEFTLAAVSMLINIAVNIHTVFSSCSLTSGILIASVLTYFLCHVNNLHQFSYLSAFGNSIVLLSILILVISGEQYIHSVSNTAPHKFYDPSGVPSSMGLVAFCYGGVGAYPKIYMSLENRSDNFKLLTVSGLVIIGIYSSVAFIGYYFFGDQTKIPVTSNIGLDSYGNDLRWGLLERSIAALGVAFNIQVTVPLILFTLRDILLPSFVGATFADSFNNTVSFVLVVICMSVALVFHAHFSMLCALVGSACTTLNSVCLPIAFHQRLFQDSLSRTRICLHATILIVVVLSSFLGIASNVCKLTENKAGICSFISADWQG